MSYSVVIPMYNAEETIALCLSSILRSIPRNTEVIVVDDCSTDRSRDIVAEFPVQLICLPQNQGPSAARNRGVEQASHSKILFVDSDVEVQSTAIQKLVDALEQDPELVGANALPSFELPSDDWASHYVNISLIVQLQAHGTRVNTAFTSLSLIRRDLWMKMGGWDESQKGRYVDDVQTRWFLKEELIAQVFEARFIHHKTVSWKGMLKHRFNLGYHFWGGIPKEKDKKEFDWRRTIIHIRYPLNTVLALGFWGLFFVPIAIVPFLLLVIWNNLACAKVVRQRQSLVRTLSVFPVSLLEGEMFLFGLMWGVFRAK